MTRATSRRTAIGPPELDARDSEAIVSELELRRPGYVPEWEPRGRGAGDALVQIAARYLQTVGQRLNRAPIKNELAFLDTMGIRPIPATAARAPMVFRLSDNVIDMRLPRGTRVAAPPPPGSQDQVIFETEKSLGLAAARLVEVVSLWPGRDGWIDHSAAVAAEQPFRPWRRAELEPTPHAIYLAHDRFLALAGESRVAVTFDLATGSSDWLDVRWESWDGTGWRPFLDMRPQCAGDEPTKLDGTIGFQRSGTVYLDSDCADTQPTTVNGVTGYWVRGVLDETLPANPSRVLPEIDRIRLATEISRPLSVGWKVAIQSDSPANVFVSAGSRSEDTFQVVDTQGAPLPGVWVRALDAGELRSQFATRSDGFAPIVATDCDELSATVGDSRFVTAFQEQTDLVDSVSFTLSVTGMDLDLAAVDDTIVDVSKPFYPFGLLPQPGSVFAISSAEVFSRVGATVRLYIQPAPTVPDQLDRDPASRTAAPHAQHAHTVAWEYWNGDRWEMLAASQIPPVGVMTPLDFTGTGFIEFVVPDDLAPTAIADQTALWIRARLLAGGYGYTDTIVFENGSSFEFFVPRPPSVSVVKLGYVWQDGPEYPEHVLTHNDFGYADVTDPARWPGPPVRPFSPVSDASPALYLGFDRPLPIDDIGIWLDIEEIRGESGGPALRWEYWDGFSWQPLIVDDETRALRSPGIARFIGPSGSRAFARFGTERHWLRARLAEDGLPGEPTIVALALNAVWASQQQTVLDEALGASTGQPNQVLAFRQLPVLPGSRGAGLATRPMDAGDESDEPPDWELEGQWIEVRELAGMRANVQWRLLAAELNGGSAESVREIERRLGREGAQTEIRYGDLRLVRDRTKRVTEAWVRWRERPTLAGAERSERVFVVDRSRGRLLFGDGDEGMAPPAGAAVQARRYRSGGGESGNLPKGVITQLLAPLGGVEGIWNARPAEGGADGETTDSLLSRGPHTIRHRGRPLAVADYETLARESSAAVAVARAIGCRGPDGRFAPGWVTLVVIPRSGVERPFPTLGLRERVRAHVTEAATADIGAALHVRVVGPEYIPVDVDARIVPRPSADAGGVEIAARTALGRFLHPLRGGPDRLGWEPGRSVYLSDVAAVLERVPGVDFLEELALSVSGVRQGERAVVGVEQTVVAGAMRLQLTGAV